MPSEQEHRIRKETPNDLPLSVEQRIDAICSRQHYTSGANLKHWLMQMLNEFNLTIVDARDAD